MSVVWTILASILVFGAIIMIHELGHFFAARLNGITVTDFSFGMGPKLLHFKKGDTTYCLRLFPIGGSCTMLGDDEDIDEKGSFSKAKVWRRVTVIIAGAVMNLVLGFIVLFGLTATSPYIKTRTVAGFSENSVAEQAGFMVGDTIVAVNGRNMYTTQDIEYELVRMKDNTADFVVLRDGEKISIPNVQFNTKIYSDGSEGPDIDFYIKVQEKTFGSVLKESALWTVSITRLIFVSFVDLITGNVPINQLSGPVGIVGVISEAASIGIGPVLLILAFISINLGVFNLLPLPALDGGRLVFLIFEGITRKKFPMKYEAIVHFAGIILLFGLMIFVTYNDISKLFTG